MQSHQQSIGQIFMCLWIFSAFSFPACIKARFAAYACIKHLSHCILSRALFKFPENFITIRAHGVGAGATGCSRTFLVFHSALKLIAISEAFISPFPSHRIRCKGRRSRETKSFQQSNFTFQRSPSSLSRKQEAIIRNLIWRD